MKDFSFAERKAVHILSSWAFTEGVTTETGTTYDMACAGWWEVFCSVRDAIDKHLDGRDPRSDEESDAASQAGINALPTRGTIKNEDARITEELAEAVNTWQPIPHKEHCFSEKNAVRVVVVKTDRKLGLNWTERFDVAYEAIHALVGEREPNDEEVGRAIKAAEGALAEAYPESS